MTIMLTAYILSSPPPLPTQHSLRALSYGETELTVEHYMAAKAMDKAAQDRVAALPTRTAAPAAPSAPSTPSTAAR
jgi:hypothetical protein